MDLFGRNRRALERAQAKLAQAMDHAMHDRLEPALTLFEEADREARGSSDAGMRALGAGALFHVGVVQDRLGPKWRAEQTWKELGNRYGADGERQVAEWVVRGLFNLCHRAQKDGLAAEASALCEDLQRRWDIHKGEPFESAAFDSLSNLALAHHEAGRHEDAVGVSRRLLQRLELRGEPRSSVHHINALGVLGNALVALGRADDGLAAIDQTLAHLASYTGYDRLERTVGQLKNKGLALVHLAREREAVACFSAAFDATRDSREPEVLFIGALALVGKARAQRALQEPAAELESLETLSLSAEGEADQRTLQLARWALMRGTDLLHELGREDDAAAMAGRLDALSARTRDFHNETLAANALLTHLSDLSSTAERLDVLDSVALDGPDAFTRAVAVFGKGRELAGQGRFGEAISALNVVIGTLNQRQDDAAADLLAEAMLHRASALGELGCADQALSELAEVERRFAEYHGKAGETVRKARNTAASLQAWAAEMRDAYPGPRLLREMLEALDERGTAGHGAGRLAATPHFMEGKVHNATLAAEFSYAAHDRAGHERGETGFAMVASLLTSVKRQVGRGPSALVVAARATVKETASPDSNHQLMTEALAVFGLPPRVAAEHTHLGHCAARLGYQLHDAGTFPDAALFHYEEGRGERP